MGAADKAEAVEVWTQASEARNGFQRHEEMPLAATLTLAGLAAAACAHGAYFRYGQVVAGGLIAAAATVAFRGGRRPDWDWPQVLAGCLAGWCVVSALVAGRVAAGVGPALLLAGCIVVRRVCRALPRSQAGAFADGLILLGAAVGASGLAAMAFRWEPWALADGPLWRAATTLTYANAAAGFLVPLALLALARHVGHPTAGRAVTCCLLLMSAGATLSRGCATALVVGLVVLAAKLGAGRVAAALCYPGAGAILAVGLLAATADAGREPRPWLALAGVAAALALARLGEQRPVGRRGRLLPLAVGVAVVGVALGAATVVGTGRAGLASSDRANEATAALRVGMDHPLFGAGPGQAPLSWREPDGTTLHARYAHNEYLQAFADLGLIGLALVLALVISITVNVRRAVLLGGSPGAAAGLAAMAVHSGLDFLWHIPAVLLLAAAFAGIANASLKENA